MGPGTRKLGIGRAFHGYGIALFFVAVAFLSTLLLQHLFPYPFLFLFFGAVMASAWFGGMSAGIFSVFVSTLLVAFFFVPPFYSFSVNTTAEAYFLAFVACALVASWVSSSKRNSEQALMEARDELELRVKERTAELQKSNIELRESEHHLRQLTEVIPQQIWRGTPDGTIDYCNQRLLDYMGRTLEDVRGESFLQTIHPEDRDDFQQAWRHALMTGTSFEGEWRVMGAEGHYRWFFTRAVPLLEPQRRTIGWYGTNTDIEERKNAEHSLMKAQAEAAHLARMLTMGELTASIAHELNQPLAAVVMNGHACLEWLSAEMPNIEKGKESAEKIVQDGSRAGVVLRTIRALFKKESRVREALDMNGLIQEVIVFLRDEAINRRVSVKTDLAADLPEILGDRVQLQQVVLNLMINGMDAMSATASGAKELLIGSVNSCENEIIVRIEDSGTGLNPELFEKIFDPFFTTKPQGIGMGLSISRSIVESHEGRLWASPRPSGGTIFQFTLPVSPAQNDA
jgi:PAS domain S-box-containing protein